MSTTGLLPLNNILWTAGLDLKDPLAGRTVVPIPRVKKGNKYTTSFLSRRNYVSWTGGLHVNEKGCAALKSRFVGAAPRAETGLTQKLKVVKNAVRMIRRLRSSSNLSGRSREGKNSVKSGDVEKSKEWEKSKSVLDLMARVGSELGRATSMLDSPDMLDRAPIYESMMEGKIVGENGDETPSRATKSVGLQARRTSREAMEEDIPPVPMVPARHANANANAMPARAQTDPAPKVKAFTWKRPRRIFTEPGVLKTPGGFKLALETSAAKKTREVGSSVVTVGASRLDQGIRVLTAGESGRRHLETDDVVLEEVSMTQGRKKDLKKHLGVGSQAELHAAKWRAQSLESREGVALGSAQKKKMAPSRLDLRIRAFTSSGDGAPAHANPEDNDDDEVLEGDETSATQKRRNEKDLKRLLGVGSQAELHAARLGAQMLHSRGEVALERAQQRQKKKRRKSKSKSRKESWGLEFACVGAPLPFPPDASLPAPPRGETPAGVVRTPFIGVEEHAVRDIFRGLNGPGLELVRSPGGVGVGVGDDTVAVAESERLRSVWILPGMELEIPIPVTEQTGAEQPRVEQTRAEQTRSMPPPPSSLSSKAVTPCGESRTEPVGLGYLERRALIMRLERQAAASWKKPARMWVSRTESEPMVARLGVAQTEVDWNVGDGFARGDDFAIATGDDCGNPVGQELGVGIRAVGAGDSCSRIPSSYSDPSEYNLASSVRPLSVTCADSTPPPLPPRSDRRDFRARRVDVCYDPDSLGDFVVPSRSSSVSSSSSSVLHGTPFFHDEEIYMVEVGNGLKGKGKAERDTDDSNLTVTPQVAQRVDSGNTSIPIRNPDSSPVSDECYDPNWIRLFVGEKCPSIHPAERQPLSLSLPAKSLLQHSKDLRTRYEVAGGQTIHLPRIDPNIFPIFVRWIQGGGLRVQQPSTKAKPLLRNLRIDECFAAWKLGQELLAPGIQNACVDQIVQIAIDQSSADPSNLPYAYINHAYAITTQGSGLRRLFRAIMCEERLPKEWLLNDEMRLEKIGAVAYEEYRRERSGESGKRWDRVKRGKEGRSWREGGEQFHE